MLCSGAFKVTAMNLLPECYNSNSSISPEDECLTEKEFRSVYLVTYSQADMAKYRPAERAFLSSLWVALRNRGRTKT